MSFWQQFKQDWKSTQYYKDWNSTTYKKDWDQALKSYQVALPKVDWHKHNPLYMSIFIMFAAVMSGMIYLAYDNVNTLNEETQANVANTLIPSRKITVEINEGSQPTKEYSYRFSSTKSTSTIFNMLNNLSESGKIRIHTEATEEGIVLDRVNDKVNVTNGKTWKVYLNGELVSKSIDQVEVRGGDVITLTFR